MDRGQDEVQSWETLNLLWAGIRMQDLQERN